MKVIVNKNGGSTVNFSKVARVVVGLNDLYDVNHTGRQSGDVLVFDANTNTYIVETLQKIDGGVY